MHLSAEIICENSSNQARAEPCAFRRATGGPPSSRQRNRKRDSSPLAAITLAWQWLTLPAMPSDGEARQSSALGLLRRRGPRVGIAAVPLRFAGQFALFTYVRSFLEDVTRLSVSALSVGMLLLTLWGLIGTGAPVG
jgi:hypothetical protein